MKSLRSYYNLHNLALGFVVGLLFVAISQPWDTGLFWWHFAIIIGLTLMMPVIGWQQHTMADYEREKLKEELRKEIEQEMRDRV